MQRIDSLSSEIISTWTEIVGTNPHLTPFHTYQWLSSWVEAYRENANSFVLTNRGTGGVVRSLLPLMTYGNELRTLCYNATDYTGLVWVSDDPESVSPIADYLLKQSGRQVVLWNVRQQDPLVRRLREEQHLRQVKLTECLSVDLRSAQYRQDRHVLGLSKRELEQKIMQLYDSGYKVVFSDSISDGELAQMVDLHTGNWNRRNQLGKFADQRRRDFVKLLASGRLPMLYTLLKSGSRIAAYKFGPTRNATYYDWNSGYDEALSKLSPGSVLLAETLRRLPFERSILSVDFLRGDEGYKRAWATSADAVFGYEVV